MKKFKSKVSKRMVAAILSVVMIAVAVPDFFTKMTVEASASAVDFDEDNIAMSFAVMTDLHLHQASNSSATNVQRQVQRYANTVATLNQMAKANSGEGLDLLMLTGDYCDVGTEVQATAFATATQQILAELQEVNNKKPGFIMAYGNHETEAGMSSTVNPHMTYEAWETLLDKYGLKATAKDENGDYVPWGCNHESIVKDGKTYHFLSLEIYSYVSPTNMILNEALTWLDNELAEITTADPNSYIYFACHGPTQESGVYGTDMNFDVNAWWGAAKSGVNGWTYASDAQYPTQKATSGNLDEVLKKYPQVVHFSGHYHYSNILESSIMQKNYTAIALSALSDSSLGSAGNNGFYDGLTNMTENNLYNGYSLLVEVDADGNQRITRVKMDTTYSEVLDATVTFQTDDAETTDLYNDAGTLVEYRDESKNTANVEFSANQVATPNTMTPWVMMAPNNLTGKESHLYTYSQEARVGTPVFAQDATLEITDIVKASDDSVNFKVTFDTVGAKTADTNYVMRYELELYNQDGDLLNAGKSYKSDASSTIAQTGSYWFIGNWASSKNGIVDGCGTTHKDATKLSYDLSLTSSQLTDTTGIYAKLYAVDEFGGKSEPLTYGSKSELLNVAHIIKNGGFEKGSLVNWSDGTTAEPLKEAKQVTITGLAMQSATVVELYFYTDSSYPTADWTTLGTVDLLKNSEAMSWKVVTVGSMLMFNQVYSPVANDIIQIPKVLDFICNGETYEIANDFAVQFDGTKWAKCEATPTEEEVGPIAAVTDTVRSGEYSLRFNREDTTKKFIRTDINSISPETEYKLTYYINTPVSSAVEATVYEYSFNNKIVGKHQVEVYGSTSDWKVAELTFTTSAGADKLGLILTAKGSTGVVYVDDITLEAQGAEKVQLSYDDSNGDGRFDVKDIVRMKKALKNGKTELATQKYADRNGDGTFDNGDAAALRKKAVGVVDDFTKVIATDGDINAFGVKLQSDSLKSHMVTGGNYSNETFTFTTEYKAGLRIGVHMPETLGTSFYDQSATKGLIIALQNQYAGFYVGNAYKSVPAQSLYSYTYGAQGTLIDGETYVFSLYLKDNGDGTQTLYLDARKDSVMVVQLHRTFSVEECTNIPTSGQFVVWSQVPCQEMLYQVVATENPTRVVVDAENGQDGVVTLNKDATTGMGYLVLDGDYSTEHYRFTTSFDLETITGETGLGLYIGVNKQDSTSTNRLSNGLTIQLNGARCTSYICNNNTNVQHQTRYWSGTLQPNVEYTFDIQVAGKLMIMNIYRGTTLHSTVTIGASDDDYHATSNTSYTVYDKGSFILYTTNEKQKIAWDMPEKDLSVVEVDADKAAGSAFVTTDNPDVLTDSAYVTTKSTYTTEAIEFTTVLEQVDNIVLGVRMSGKAHNPATYSGLYIQFTEDGSGYTVYNQGTSVASGTLTTPLVAGEKYTFRLSINGTKLRFDIEKGGANIHYAKLDVSSTTIPETGYFVVWSMDACHTIDYSKIIEGGHTKVVASDDKAGTFVLNGNASANAPYLVMDGEYTTEVFRFTTMFEQSMQVGMHMTENDGYWPHGPGFVLVINSSGWAGYCVSTLTEPAHNSGHSTMCVGNFGTALEANQEYTFEFSMNGKNFTIRILKDGEVLNTVNSSIWYYDTHGSHIPTAGDFIVWSEAEGRKISYEIPVLKPSTTVTTNTSGTTTLFDDPYTSDSLYPYLVVDGEYTTETFSVTTKLSENTGYDLLLGAHITTNSSNWQGSPGIIFDIRETGLNVYCVDSAKHTANSQFYRAQSVYSWTLETDVEYTFVIQMDTSAGTGTIKVMQGDKVVQSRNGIFWNLSGDTGCAAHISQSGDFMVWSGVNERELSYEVK